MIVPRPEVWGAAERGPAIHGGNPDEAILDFSTGVSPFAAPRQLVDTIRNAELSRYPHPTAAPARVALARFHGVTSQEIVVGAGSVEIIWALARAFAGEGRAGVVLAPAFGEYAHALMASGAQVREVRAAPPAFRWSPDRIIAELSSGPSVVFICRPSNPCLASLPHHLVTEIARRFPSVLFVIDEAYQPLFEGVATIPRTANIAIVRSLTKVFALPGLRIGYLVAAREIARAVQVMLPPWNVSAPAQAAAICAAPSLREILPGLRGQTTALRDALVARLRAERIQIDAQGGPFLLCAVSDADRFSGHLLQRGIAVRSCSSFGLPHHVRLGIRPEPEQEALVRALRGLRESGDCASAAP